MLPPRHLFVGTRSSVCVRLFVFFVALCPGLTAQHPWAYRYDPVQSSITELSRLDASSAVLGSTPYYAPATSARAAAPDLATAISPQWLTAELRRLPGTDEQDPAPAPPGSDEAEKENTDTDERDAQRENDPDEPIGEAPEDVSEIFLRQSNVLLQPGEGQIDFGLLYTWQEVRQPVVFSDGTVGVEMLRDRQLVVPVNVRYGVMDRLLVFAELPMGYAIFERADLERDNVTSRLGTGDLVAGFRYLLFEETTDCPDVIGSISVGAPIGNHAFHAGDAAAIGSGFWSTNFGVSLIKSFDPIVLYSGYGYTHFFEAEHLGQSLQPGELFNYSFGLGFAVNDSIVLSSEFVGGLQTYFYADGRRIPNSLTEPFSLRFAVTQVVCQDHFVEPYVILGLNSDAPDVQVGIFHTTSF